MKKAKKILLAEDELLVAMVMKLALEKKGFTVKHVADANSVISEAREFVPDIIVLDVCLKNKSSGIEASLLIRKENIRTPIIFTTGNSMEQTRMEIKEVSGSHLFIKPIDADQLVSYIERTLI